MSFPSGVNPVDARGYATQSAFGSLTSSNTWSYATVQDILGPTDATNIYALDPRFQQNINIENIYQLYNGRSLKQYSLSMTEAILIKNLDFTQLLFPPRLTLEKTFEFFTSKINMIPHHRIPPGGLPNVFTTSKMNWRTTIESYGLMGHVGLREALDPNYGKEKLNEIVYGESISAVYSIRANALRELVVDGYNNAILGTFGMVSARNNPQDQFLVETQTFAVAAYSKAQFFAMVSNATRRIIPAKKGAKHLVIMWPGGRLYINQSMQPARAGDFRAWMSVQDPVTLQLFVQDLEVSPEGVQILNNDFNVGWVEAPVMRLSSSDEDPEYFVTRACLAEHYAARLVDHINDELNVTSNGAQRRLESSTTLSIYSIDTDNREVIPKEAALLATGLWNPNPQVDLEEIGMPDFSEGVHTALKQMNMHNQQRPPAYLKENETRVNAYLMSETVSYAPDDLLKNLLLCAYWDATENKYMLARNIGQLERMHMPRAAIERIAMSLLRMVDPGFKNAFTSLVQLVQGWAMHAPTDRAQQAVIETLNAWSVDPSGNFRGALSPSAQVKRFGGALVLHEFLRNGVGGVPVPDDTTMAKYATSPDEIIPFCLSLPMLKTIVMARYDNKRQQWAPYGKVLEPLIQVLEASASVISKVLPGNAVTDDLDATSPWIHVTGPLNGLYQNAIADLNPVFAPVYARRASGDVPQDTAPSALASVFEDLVLPDGTSVADNFDFTAPEVYTARFPGRYGATLGARIQAANPAPDIVRGVLALPSDFVGALPLRLSDAQNAELSKRLDAFGNKGAFARRLALEAALLLTSADASVAAYLNAKNPTQDEINALYKAMSPALNKITDVEIGELKALKEVDATAEALRGGVVGIKLRQTGPAAALTTAEQTALKNAIKALLAANATTPLKDILTQLQANPAAATGLADAGTYAAAVATFGGKLTVNLVRNAAGGSAGASANTFDFGAPVSTYARTPLTMPRVAFEAIYSRASRLLLMSDPDQHHNRFLQNAGTAAEVQKKLASPGFGLVRATALFENVQSMENAFTFARAIDPVLVDPQAEAPASPSSLAFASVNAPFGRMDVDDDATRYLFNNAPMAPMAQNNASNLMYRGPWKARLTMDFASRRNDPSVNALILCVLSTPLTYRAAVSMAASGLDLFVDLCFVRPSITFSMYNLIVAATQCGTLFMNPPNVRAAIDVKYQDIYLISEIYFRAVIDTRDQIQLLPNVCPKGYNGGFNHHLMYSHDYKSYATMAESLRPSVLTIPMPITERLGSIMHLNNDEISQNVINRLNATALQTTSLSSLQLIKAIWPALYEEGERDARARILSNNETLTLSHITLERRVQLLSQRGPSTQRAITAGTYREVPGISPLSRPGMQTTGAAAVWRGAGGEFRAGDAYSITHHI